MEFDIHIKSLDDIKPACIELFENEMKARRLTLIDVMLGVT